MIDSEALFSFLGQLIAYGGGGAAVAYLLFQFLGKSWIENKFAEKLEQLRHAQARELQRLRVEIDSMLSGAIKLQDKEFETLPEAWVKLDEAYSQVARLVSPVQQYPDLDRLSDAQLEEFFVGTKLRESQKEELRHSQQKTTKYQEIIFWNRVSEVRGAIAELHNYIERNSIFLPPELKQHFEKAANDLWSSIVSKEVGHSAKDWKMESAGWDKIQKEIEPLRKTIEAAIYKRLQAHGKAQSDSSQ